MKKMEMRIGAIGIDEKSGDPIVVLRDTENTRVLPIWIGLPEARAITLAVNKVSSPRPLTHDLLYSTIVKLGCKVKEVLIDKIESHTFIATIYLAFEGQEYTSPPLAIDARPSDAIALALKADAPLMVAESIIAEAGLPVVAPQEKDEEFSKFVSDLKASDFKLSGNVELPPDDEQSSSPSNSAHLEKNEGEQKSPDADAESSDSNNQS